MESKDNLHSKLRRIMYKQEFFKEISLEDNSETTIAQINLENHELSIAYNPNWAKKYIDEDLRIYLEKKNITDPLFTLLRDCLFHEILHRGTRKSEGCPKDYKRYSENFLDPIYEITKFENKDTLAYFGNTLTDIIANTIGKKTNSSEGITTMDGIIMFYKEQGMNHNEKFSKMYESLVRLSLCMYGDQHDKKLLKKYFTQDKEINQAIINFLNRTGIKDMKAGVYQGNKIISVKDKNKIRDFLADEINWKNIAKIYAEEFGKFMKEEIKEQLPGTGGNAGSSNNNFEDSKPGQGSNGKNKSKKETPSGNDPGSDSLEKGTGQNGRHFKSGKNDKANAKKDSSENEQENPDGDSSFSFADGICRPLNQRDIIRELIKSGLLAGRGPGWMNDFEYLVGLYEVLASNKLAEIKFPEMESKQYPLVTLRERLFDLDSDSARDISGIIFDSAIGGLELSIGDLKHNVRARVKEKQAYRPDIILGNLDTSSSMLLQMPEGLNLGEIVNPKGHPQWRYNCKYHVSLITYFMLCKRFEELRIDESSVYFTNFSEITMLDRGLKRSLKTALCPQFGGTTIDINLIERILSKDNLVVFTISDGEIENDVTLAEKMIEINQKNAVFHVQIGNHSCYSKNLKKNGINVVLVKKEDDLFNFAIDLTDKLAKGEL